MTRNIYILFFQGRNSRSKNKKPRHDHGVKRLKIDVTYNSESRRIVTAPKAKNEIHRSK